MKNIWTIICEKSLIDTDSNLISLINSLETINVNLKVKKEDDKKNSIHSVAMNYEIVSYWFRDKELVSKDYNIKMDLISPDGKTLNTFNQIMNFPEKISRLRSRMQVSGLTVNKSGTYYIVTSYLEDNNYIEISKNPFEIIINKELI